MLGRLGGLFAATPDITLRWRGSVGEPLAVSPRFRRCARVEEVWRIEEGWWRPKPVRRTYFRLALEDGLLLTVYLDDLEGSWWSQRY